MKITDVRVIGKRMRASNAAFVVVETDEGITGIGATSAPAAIVAALIEDEGGLRPMLLGEDPTDTNRLWGKMAGGWPAQRGRGGEGGLAINAMAAIDIALWDIAGKARGLPIYKLLGGAVQPRVMAYASTSRTDRRVKFKSDNWVTKGTKEMVQECREYVARGFKAIKFGWGNYFTSEAQDSLAAIRDALGPDIRLMLDFGCPAYLANGWNVKDAIKVARLLEKYDLFFLEEALHPYDVEGFAELRRHSPVKIATGESLTTARQFQTFFEARAIDVAQPDIQQMGMTQFIRVAQRAEEAGIPCIPHGPWTAILVAGHLNVLSTLSNGIMIEYFGFASFEEGTEQQVRTHAFNQTVVDSPITLEDGYLRLPELPGLGLGNFVPEVIAELEAG